MTEKNDSEQKPKDIIAKDVVEYIITKNVVEYTKIKKGRGVGGG